MAEYIDREHLLRKFNAKEMTNFEGTLILLDDARDLISKQPAVDVTPVRHGRWIEADEEIFECSQCHADWVFAEETPEEMNLAYCPVCGAKMDGTEEGND